MILARDLCNNSGRMSSSLDAFIPIKPSDNADLICFSVMGEQLPEITSRGSAGSRFGQLGSVDSNKPFCFQADANAYSIPDEPTVKNESSCASSVRMHPILVSISSFKTSN